jgi:hypothetical protein
MSPEYKVVLNRRGEKSFRQLYVEEETPLASRVEITASHFGVEVKEIVDVLEDIRSVLLDGQEAVFSGEEREKHSGRDLRNYFTGRLRNLGISPTHSRNLYIGVVNHLALVDGEYKSESWWNSRHNLLRRLDGKIS